MIKLKLYNTLTKSKDEFQPLAAPPVGMYTCGPTVYHYAHLGNLRSYVFADILKRTLIYNGYPVKHVMNITDVGHLTADRDDGEDKVEIGAAREKKSVADIIDFYTAAFKHDLKTLNIQPPDIWCKASDHIKEQIELIQKLEAKGFTYKTSDGLYFDTAKDDDYGKLVNLDIKGLNEGARVAKNSEKKNATDFALWKFSPTDKQRAMEWPSPWGKGFPGWHIECSAMSMKYLGETFEIHTGGIDHAPLHHTNEIAQSESATGKPLARWWLHNEFLTVGEELKMSKSADNFLTLAAISEQGFDPLAYRYHLLLTHYRQQMRFTWEGLMAAANALNNLRQALATDDKPTVGCAEYEARFLTAINDDLNTPQALAVVWELLKSDYPSTAKKRSLLKFDRVLGLGLDKVKAVVIVKVPAELQPLIMARAKARAHEDWTTADRLRSQVKAAGFEIEDLPDGTQQLTR